MVQLRLTTVVYKSSTFILEKKINAYYRKNSTFDHASFHLWCKENLLNHQKVSKYYEHDCPQNFLLLFMSLLTALIVEYSHI